MRVIKSALLGIAFMAFGAALSAAEAAVVWDVSGTFSDGTTLTGSFSTDVYGYVQSANLVTQTKGAFTGFDYTLADSYSSSGLNFVDFQPGYTSDLHLQFADALTSPTANNPIIDAVSYECQGSFSCYVPSGGVTRYLTGGVEEDFGAAVGAVPEPATWAMLLIGFFSVGTALRLSRRRQLKALATA
jgi:ABC-type phosphate transport system substrate-binding protein